MFFEQSWVETEWILSLHVYTFSQGVGCWESVWQEKQKHLQEQDSVPRCTITNWQSEVSSPDRWDVAVATAQVFLENNLGPSLMCTKFKKILELNWFLKIISNVYTGRNSCYINTFLREQESGHYKSSRPNHTSFPSQKNNHGHRHKYFIFHNLIKYGIFKSAVCSRRHTAI